MKYLSLFSGIGGFELGIQKAYENNTKCKSICPKSSPKECEQGGVGSPDECDKMLCDSNRSAPLCIGYSEIDKYAIQAYNKHFKHKNYGDATKIDTRQLPDFDLLVGGFPCQAFSIAGKRKGFDEARGTLFFDIARILADKKPRHFILENVKGLLSHDGGRTFTTIIRILSSMGYFVEWEVLNAKSFGVPQNRERVFIVGHLGGQPRRKVFPIGEPTGKDINQLNQPTHSNNRIYGDDGINPALNTMGGGNRQPKIVKVQGDVDKRKAYLGDIASTLAVNPTSDNTARALIGGKIRRLTPLECERLMAYPDNWTAEGTEGKISDTQRYKMCGNGIVSNCVEEVVKRIYKFEILDKKEEA
jgi:DNA (cytosine-5)-methyltransferase 1